MIVLLVTYPIQEDMTMKMDWKITKKYLSEQ